MPESSFDHPLFGHVRFRTAHQAWLRGDDITFISGFDIGDITSVSIPQLKNIPGSHGGKLMFHKRAHAQLVEVFANLERLDLMKHIKTCAGSLNFRLRRPTSGALSKLPSNHAFGIAIDLNADDGSNGASVAPVAPVFEALGFKWGISFSDPMHFEVEEFVDAPHAISTSLTTDLATGSVPPASTISAVTAPGPSLVSTLPTSLAPSVHNAYPDLPEIPFVRTQVAEQDVVAYIAGITMPVAVKRACYVIFRNESANGHKGINNNYIGLQADGGRQSEKWTPFIAGTCVHAENMTGRLRRFVCFRSWTTCADILAEKISLRGLYVGGYAHPYANMHIDRDSDWPVAYWREWVQGDSNAQIPQAEQASLMSIYTAAVGKFPQDGQPLALQASAVAAE
jgi:hypothetical protein